MSYEIPPWLSHLRTDRRGLPVPYVNLWGQESTDRISLRYDHNVGGPALFMDDSDETEPDFTRQNMQRQRECTIRGLCQVCARQIPWSRRTLVVADISLNYIQMQGRIEVVLSEPWMCHRCALFAVERCPALIRRRRDENLTIVPVTSSTHCETVISTGWVEGPLEAESQRVMPAMWAKIRLLSRQPATAPS